MCIIMSPVHDVNWSQRLLAISLLYGIGCSFVLGTNNSTHNDAKIKLKSQ